MNLLKDKMYLNLSFLSSDAESCNKGNDFCLGFSQRNQDWISDFLPGSAWEILAEVLHQFERIKLWHSHDPTCRLETEVYWKEKKAFQNLF